MGKNFDLRKFLTETRATQNSRILAEMPNSNLELKNVAKQLYSGFKKMGADVELSAHKVTLNQAPSGNLDHKNVWLYVDPAGSFLQVRLVGDKAIGFEDKIKKDFSRFKFKDFPDSKSWDSRTVKTFNILPGATTSEAFVNDVPFYDEIEISSVEVDGVDSADYPDFSDSFISYAEFKNGTPLSDEELDLLNDSSAGMELAQELALDSLSEDSGPDPAVPEDSTDMALSMLDLKETKEGRQFDLKKFLTENKLTTNSKRLNEAQTSKDLLDS